MGAIKTIERFRPIVFMESFSEIDFQLLQNIHYKIYTMSLDRANPRYGKFINIADCNLLGSLSYKMCIAAPSSNGLLNFFEGMTRDNHDKKHLFVDI